MDIGEKIKRLRIRNNLTLEELGDRAELSKSFISQVERGQASPSIATLIDILECLGTNLPDFFSDVENETVVFSPKDFFTKENAESGYEISWIVPNAIKNTMEPIILKLERGGHSDTYPPCNGEVFGYMLTGEMYLYIGETEMRVKKGECFYFKVNNHYHLENKSTRVASLLWISTPPSF